MKRAFLRSFMKFWYPIKCGKLFLALSNTNGKLSFNVTAMFIDDSLLIIRNQLVSLSSTKF